MPIAILRAAIAALALCALTGCGEQKAAPAPEAAPAPRAAAQPAPPDGQRLFRACAICHTSAPRGTREGDMRLVGPNLHGVYGRAAGADPGFAYSPAMRASGVIWDEAALDAYLRNPQAFMRGNRMSYGGEADPEKRRLLIDYLKTLQ